MPKRNISSILNLEIVNIMELYIYIYIEKNERRLKNMNKYTFQVDNRPKPWNPRIKFVDNAEVCKIMKWSMGSKEEYRKDVIKEGESEIKRYEGIIEELREIEDILNKLKVKKGKSSVLRKSIEKVKNRVQIVERIVNISKRFRSDIGWLGDLISKRIDGLVEELRIMDYSKWQEGEEGEEGDSSPHKSTNKLKVPVEGQISMGSSRNISISVNDYSQPKNRSMVTSSRGVKATRTAMHVTPSPGRRSLQLTAADIKVNLIPKKSSKKRGSFRTLSKGNSLLLPSPKTPKGTQPIYFPPSKSSKKSSKSKEKSEDIRNTKTELLSACYPILDVTDVEEVEESKEGKEDLTPVSNAYLNPHFLTNSQGVGSIEEEDPINPIVPVDATDPISINIIGEIQSPSKEDLKEDPKEDLKEDPKEDLKEDPKEDPKEDLKEDPKEDPNLKEDRKEDRKDDDDNNNMRNMRVRESEIDNLTNLELGEEARYEESRLDFLGRSDGRVEQTTDSLPLTPPIQPNLNKYIQSPHTPPNQNILWECKLDTPEKEDGDKYKRGEEKIGSGNSRQPLFVDISETANRKKYKDVLRAYGRRIADPKSTYMLKMATPSPHLEPLISPPPKLSSNTPRPHNAQKPLNLGVFNKIPGDKVYIGLRPAALFGHHVNEQIQLPKNLMTNKSIIFPHTTKFKSLTRYPGQYKINPPSKQTNKHPGKLNDLKKDKIMGFKLDIFGDQPKLHTMSVDHINQTTYNQFSTPNSNPLHSPTGKKENKKEELPINKISINLNIKEECNNKRERVSPIISHIKNKLEKMRNNKQEREKKSKLGRYILMGKNLLPQGISSPKCNAINKQQPYVKLEEKHIDQSKQTSLIETFFKGMFQTYDSTVIHNHLPTNDATRNPINHSNLHKDIFSLKSTKNIFLYEKKHQLKSKFADLLINTPLEKEVRITPKAQTVQRNKSVLSSEEKSRDIGQKKSKTMLKSHSSTSSIALHKTQIVRNKAQKCLNEDIQLMLPDLIPNKPQMIYGNYNIYILLYRDFKNRFR